MRLLVSVKSAAEAQAALEGGADIVDAKDPSRGPLGAVPVAELTEIMQIIPEDQEASAALGDFVEASQIAHAVSASALALTSRNRPTYLKVGLAGVSQTQQAQSVLAAAVTSGRHQRSPISIIAVGYADWMSAATIPPETLCSAAAAAGCEGVLLDTYCKDGQTLLDWMDQPRLKRWLADARRAGLLKALSGSLGPRQLPVIRSLAPDVVGVRGAACEGGRAGRLTSARVAQIRAILHEASAFLQPTVCLTVATGSRNAGTEDQFLCGDAC